MTNTFRYRNFGLTFNIRGVHGVDLLNNQKVDTYYPINFRRNKLAKPYLNRWTPEDPSNKFPSFIRPASQGANSVNTRTVEDASYIRLQNVRLSYDIPVNNVKAFRAFRVYVSGSNLFTITDYDGMDPAANIIGTNNAALRIDYN